MRDIKYIDTESISEMIAKAESKRDEIVIKVFFETFCRSNELRQIRISDIKFNKNQINFRAETTKTKKPRVAVISETLKTEIKAWLESTGRQAKANNTEYLFKTRQGETISNKRIQQIVKGYADQLGINEIYKTAKDKRKLYSVTPHTLRHSAIIHALDRGIPQTAVMQQSGHTSLRSFQIYSQFSVEDRRKLFLEKGFYDIKS